MQKARKMKQEQKEEEEEEIQNETVSQSISKLSHRQLPEQLAHPMASVCVLCGNYKHVPHRLHSPLAGKNCDMLCTLTGKYFTCTTNSGSLAEAQVSSTLIYQLSTWRQEVMPAARYISNWQTIKWLNDTLQALYKLGNRWNFKTLFIIEK